MNRINITGIIQKYASKKFIWLLLIFILLIISSELVDAQESSLSKADVYVDNVPISTEYVLKDGYFLVPALFFKEMGSYVDWNEEYDSIEFHLNNISFAHPTGSSVIDINTNNKWEREELSTPSIHVDGQTFVPLNDITKHLGLEVTYNEYLKKTFVKNPNVRNVRRIGSGDGTKNYIALTFDDGPDPLYTPQILDILKDKGVPATFFAIGEQVKKHPEIMQRIVKEGHAIGNHSFTHPEFPKIQSNEVRDEISNTQEVLSKTIGRKPDLFRPPYGALTRADEEFLHQVGFQTIMWSVDTLDWTGLSGDKIFQIVVNQIEPGGIVLQHNIDWNPDNLNGTVEALPRIIEELQHQGYTFVTVQTLLD
ncbi:polysaccharide deacetylase family protein [Salipaludibacillus sp. HK11]|uniref:polysaccharide deacetylase family protein n=1 Tax=Salipaludibacillus sp. HK11 TaxID=3394320 RepID=UPI0039FC2770